ncbi:MAG: DUF6391 domain-containing protein [Leptolinea sp.]
MNLISKIRKHHAVEHACLSIIHAKFPALKLAGYSDARGFWIVGNVETDKIIAAVDEAITRLQAGEKSLAVHPNCGTNFAASGLVAGSLAWLGTIGSGKSFRRHVDRWPLIITLVTFGLIAAQPLGPYLQRAYTTDANIGELKMKEIIITKRGTVTIHRFKLGR